MAEISLKQVNILMECGADFTMGIVIRDDSNSLVDLTGYTVTAQLREYAEAQDYMEFTATHNNAGGRITISMPHEDTAQISYTSGVYDVFIIDTNNISEKVVKGEVTVDPNVTKPIAGTIMYLVSFASEDDFPTTGEMRRLYFSHASRKMYRWNGTNYIGIITDGEAATVEVGTVTTLDAGEDATVENVGSLTNAVFDFGIPKGDPGTTSWEGITDKPETFTPSAHTHDDRYYTETEVDTALSGKSDTSHTHDDRYYTESETNTLLSAKADSSDVATALSAKADASSVYTKTQTDTLLNEKEDTANLGDLAYEDTVNYDTEVTNKPTLGALSELNTLNYTSELLTNKPTLGTMAQKNDANSDNKYYVRRNDAWVDADGRYYTESEVDTKLALKADESSLGTLASQDDTGVDGKQYVRKDGAWEDLADTLSEKADIIRTTASGSIAHITDGAAYPVDSLSVSIDPVQDLHGYDAPWPAGGGKNLMRTFADGTHTVGTMTVTISNGKITLNGSSTSDGYYEEAVAETSLPNTVYIQMNNATTSYNFNLVFIYNNTQVGAYSGNAVNRISDVSSALGGKKYDKVRVYWTANSSFTNYAFTPMLTSDSTPLTAYVPYSNICPISGHTSATVTRTGKNLWEFDSSYSGASAGYVIPVTTLQTPILPGTYAWSCNGTLGNACAIYFKDSDGTNIYSTQFTGSGKMSATFTLTKTVYKLQVYSSGSYRLSDIQFEVGSTANAYESPHIQTVTVNLGGTYYGGTLDVLTGTLTVTHKRQRFLSTMTWTGNNGWNTYCYYTKVNDIKLVSGYGSVAELICSHLKIDTPGNLALTSGYHIGVGQGDGNSIFVNFGQFATADDLKAFLADNEVYVVYPLATPTVITGLTPATLSLLLGENNVWSDTGDTTVGYRASTKLYIDSKLSAAVAELQALILENS